MTTGPPGQSAKLILAFSLLVHGMVLTIMYAVLPVFGREVGISELQIGGIISGSAFAFFWASRAWGGISDRLGRKSVLLIGLGGSGLGCGTYALLFDLGLSGVWFGTGLYFGLVGARMIQALLMSGIQPSVTAYVADITSSGNRTAGMGSISAAFNAGSILGPAVVGLLAGFSLLFPIYFGCAAIVLCVALVWWRLPDMQSPVLNKCVHKLSYFDPRLLSYLVVGFLIFLGFGVIQQTLAFRLQDMLALDARSTATHFGYMMMVSALMSLLVQVIIVRRSTLSPVWLLRIGLPLLTFTLFMLAVGGNLITIAICMVLMGFSMGLAMPGFSASVSLAVSPHEQGAAAGVAASIPALGFIVGPLVGTGFYQVEPDLPYVVSAVATIPGIVIVMQLRTPFKELN